MVSVGRESREGLWATGEEVPTAAEWVMDLFGLGNASASRGVPKDTGAGKVEVPVRWKAVQGVLVRVACEAFAGRPDVREAVMGDLRAAYDVHPVSYSRDAADHAGRMGSSGPQEVADRERMRDTIFVPDARVMNANGTCAERPGAGSPGGGGLQKLRHGLKMADAMAPPSPSPNGVREVPRRGGRGGMWGACEPTVSLAAAPQKVSAATSVEEILVALFDRLEELGFRLASGSHAGVVDGGGGKYVFHMSAEKADRLGLCAPGAGEVKARLAAKAAGKVSATAEGALLEDVGPNLVTSDAEAAEVEVHGTLDNALHSHVVLAERVAQDEVGDREAGEMIDSMASDIVGEMVLEMMQMELVQPLEKERVEMTGGEEGPETDNVQKLRSPAPLLSPSFAAFRDDTSSGMSGYETEDDVPVIANEPSDSPGVESRECTDPVLQEDIFTEDVAQAASGEVETLEQANDSENVDPNVSRDNSQAHMAKSGKSKRKPRGCRGGKQKPKIQSKTPQLLPSPEAVANGSVSRSLRSPLGLVR